MLAGEGGSYIIDLMSMAKDAPKKKRQKRGQEPRLHPVVSLFCSEKFS